MAIKLIFSEIKIRIITMTHLEQLTDFCIYSFRGIKGRRTGTKYQKDKKMFIINILCKIKRWNRHALRAKFCRKLPMVKKLLWGQEGFSKEQVVDNSAWEKLDKENKNVCFSQNKKKISVPGFRSKKGVTWDWQSQVVYFITWDFSVPGFNFHNLGLSVPGYRIPPSELSLEKAGKTLIISRRPTEWWIYRL